jgi:hypothetical protein
MPFDAVGFIMSMEGCGGELSAEEIVDGYQHLIDSGMIFSLQGSWQRAAQAMIDAGECTPPKRRQA